MDKKPGGPLRRKLQYGKSKLKELYKKFSYRLPVPWNLNFTRDFWEREADEIHDRYGNSAHDFQTVNRLLVSYKPSSLLDVGCGSGRLFEVYAQNQIQDVIGIDISARALALANQRFPNVPTVCSRLEELAFPLDRFDLAICNRVLQHIPSRLINDMVAKLCLWCKVVYINELTESDKLQENFYMFRHDYATLFSKPNFKLLEEGATGAQTYQVYGRK